MRWYIHTFERMTFIRITVTPTSSCFTELGCQLFSFKVSDASMIILKLYSVFEEVIANEFSIRIVFVFDGCWKFICINFALKIICDFCNFLNRHIVRYWWNKIKQSWTWDICQLYRVANKCFHYVFHGKNKLVIYPSFTLSRPNVRTRFFHLTVQTPTGTLLRWPFHTTLFTHVFFILAVYESRGNFITTIIAANYYDDGPSYNDINIARSRWGGIPILIHLYLYPSLPTLDVTPSTSGTYNFGVILVYEFNPYI